MKKQAAFCCLAVVCEVTAAARAGPSNGGLLDLLRPGHTSTLTAGSGFSGWPAGEPPGPEWGTGNRIWTRVESRSSVPISDRDASSVLDLGASRNGWLIGKEMRWLGREVEIAGRLANATRRGLWRDGATGVDFSRTANTFDTGFRIRDLAPGLTVSAWMPFRPTPDAGGTSWSAFEFRSRRFRVAGRSSLTRAPEPVAITLAGAAWTAPLNVVFRDERLAAVIPLGFGFETEGAAGRSRLSENSERTLDPTYHLAPGGRFESSRYGLAWSRAGYRTSYAWVHRDFDLHGTASWGGQSFGTLTYLRGGLDSRLATLLLPLGRRTGVSFEHEMVRVRAKARANVETWPFTSTAADLLGLRRIARGWAEVDFARYQIGMQRDWGRAARIDVALDWWDARPAAHLESWRPTFLLFGRSDFRVDELEWRRLEFAGLTIGGQVQRGAFRVDWHLQQIVPVRIHKRSDVATSPPAGAGPPQAAPAPERRRSWPNGTSLVFSLARIF